MHYISTEVPAASHEIAHLIQIRSGGFRGYGDHRPVGWGWEGHAHYVSLLLEPDARRYVFDLGQSFIRDHAWKRMDAPDSDRERDLYESTIPYMSWVWWQCMDLRHGRTFVARMWSNVEPRGSPFEEAARLKYQNNIPDMFVDYVKCILEKKVGPAVPQYEPVTSSGNLLRSRNPRLRRFGFVLVDVGSPKQRNQKYRVQIIPTSSHPASAWRGVFGPTRIVLTANETSPEFEGGQKMDLAICCATYENPSENVCAFDIKFT